MHIECGLLFLAGACVAVAGFLWGMRDYWGRHRKD
jgi:hypothetical protein